MTISSVIPLNFSLNARAKTAASRPHFSSLPVAAFLGSLTYGKSRRGKRRETSVVSSEGNIKPSGSINWFFVSQKGAYVMLAVIDWHAIVAKEFFARPNQSIGN